MEKLHKDVLRKCRPYLTKNLEMDLLWDILPSKCIFSDNMIEKFKGEKTNVDQARLMLTELPTRGPKAYELFLQALEESEQCHIRDKLLSTEAEISGKKRGSFDDPDTSKPIQASDELFKTQGILPIKVSATPSDLREKLSRDSKSMYKVESSPKGYMLIINNKTFVSSGWDRNGTDIDCKNLETLFSQLGFKIVIKNNLKAVDIVKAVNEFVSKPQHNLVDSCAFAILTHGSKDVVYGTDLDTVELNGIVGLFGNCDALKTKPKLFIIQACRGGMKDGGTIVNVQATDSDGSGGFPDSDPDPPRNKLTSKCQNDVQMMSQKWPNFTDLLIGFSTLPGYVSWRNKEKGSWYIQALCEVFSSHAHDEHALDLLTKVNQKVADSFTTETGEKMTPNPTYTLQKKWYFKPDGLSSE
ncbi:caspase-3-like [Tubulanus polymorphus]|uniref:caspase-3-like n=1 Tax=Tubulanus polymorphus TaxID=672921 RepID=UPI003DA3CD07